MNSWLLALIAFAGMAVIFAAVHGIARRIDNYSIVDVAWSYAFGLLAVFYAVAAPGWIGRRALLGGLVVVWSSRLGTHLYRRVMSHHPVEDARYQELRARWRDNFAGEMFKFFQMQAASVVLLGLPFLLSMRDATQQLRALEIAAAVLWVFALAGEATADAQLAAFKRDPAHRGQVCTVGLWRYSRHPNYFFEWLVWMSYFVFACATPWGWTSVIAPAAMLYLLLRVTGIPLTEQQSVRSKGDAYRRYQRTTSAFVPWPRRTPQPAVGDRL
jgi:steroid 5-alpha reductase family enzyme